jgi:hypothetical protein
LSGLSWRAVLTPDAKNPGKNEENRVLMRVLPVESDKKHHIWRDYRHSIPQFVSRKNPRDRRKKHERNKQTFIFKKFKKSW